MAPSAKLDGLSPRRNLVEGAGPVKTLIVMVYCHLSVTLLCLNVMFDLVVFGAPVYLFHIIGLLPYKIYLAITSSIINWTTPIVFTMPMVLSGTKLYCNDIDLMIESKATNSLLLANHGSVSCFTASLSKIRYQFYFRPIKCRSLYFVFSTITAYRLDGSNVLWVPEITIGKSM